MSKYLSRDAILKSNDLKRREVETPGWGGVILVREFTAKERDAYEADMVKVSGQNVSVDKHALINMRAKVVSWAAINEEGERIFKPADVVELGEKSASEVDKVYSAIIELSGMSPESVEAVEKN